MANEIVNTPVLGVNFAEVGNPQTTTDNPTIARMRIGTVLQGSNSSEFIRLQNTSGAAITVGQALYYTAAYGAMAVTTANAALGLPVAVSQVAVPIGGFFWAQIKGYCSSVLVAAGTAANTPLQTTTTPGQLASGAAAGSKNVTGLVIIATNGAAAAVQPGILKFPDIGTTN